MRRRLIAVSAAVLAIGIAPATTGAHYPNPGAVYCGQVSYKYATDWATRAWSRGAPCKEALRLAWDFKDRRYGVIDRYRCKTRIREEYHDDFGLSHSESRCVRRGSGGRVVVTLVHT